MLLRILLLACCCTLPLSSAFIGPTAAPPRSGSTIKPPMTAAAAASSDVLDEDDGGKGFMLRWSPPPPPKTEDEGEAIRKEWEAQYKAYIKKNGAQLCALAWRGYEKWGRGAIVAKPREEEQDPARQDTGRSMSWSAAASKIDWSSAHSMV